MGTDALVRQFRVQLEAGSADPSPCSLQRSHPRRELFRPRVRISDQEDVMRAYFANLTPTTQMLLAIPAVVLAYVLVTMVVPAIVHAAVPEAVRSVLRLM